MSYFPYSFAVCRSECVCVRRLHWELHSEKSKQWSNVKHNMRSQSAEAF
jgi:hypothetical protein